MNTKLFCYSKTLIGLFIASLALFCQWKGITFTTDDQGVMSDTIFKAIEAVGLAIAFVGRIVATQPLHILPTDDDDTPASPSAGTPSLGMLLLVGMLAISVLGASVLPGCAMFVQPTPMTPQDQAIKEVRQATALYIVAVTTFNNLVATGKIDKQTAADIEIVRQRAWDHLSAAKLAAEAGTLIDADTKLRLFLDDLNALNAIIFNLPYAPLPPLPSAAPTTQPTT